jgi:hypothetical protein
LANRCGAQGCVPQLDAPEAAGIEKEGIGDEFLLPAARVEEMSDGDKLAYLARLLHSFAFLYGVDPGFGYLVPGEAPLERYDRLESATRSSPGGLLRGLLDISWMPCTASSRGGA